MPNAIEDITVDIKIMTPDVALEKRNQLTKDGYCVVDDILTQDFLEELRQTSDWLLDAVEHPPHWKYQGSDLHIRGIDESAIDRLIHWQPTWDAMRDLGLGDFKSTCGFIILSKPPGGPPLYWHQDWMWWNDPLSMSPWPEFMSLSYYLTDTAVENGCLKLIPGSHLKRFPIHDELTPAHEQGARFVDDDDPIMFKEVPEQAYVPVKAGDLALMDARILHAAGRNFTDHRRTLVLSWHRRPTGTIPEYWSGTVAEAILNRDPNAEYEGSRIPGAFLKP